MKKIITLIAVVLITTITFAQAPAKMSYQAVIRDANNALVISQTVGMQISILQDSPTGTPVYVETQGEATNANGLLSIDIGGGTVVTGDFATIDWANGTYYIKTEADPTGGTTYTISGTSQLLSVPYAQYAEKAGSADDWAAVGGGNPTLAGDIYHSGNVGIGTTTPGEKLAIQDGNIVLTDGYDYSWGGGATAIEGSQAGDYIKFIVANQDRMLVDVNGNVGIGTTTPEGTLHIVDQGTTGPAIYIEGGSATEGDITWKADEHLQIGRWDPTGDIFTEEMRIDNTGRIGFGTTSPGSDLHIKQSGNTLIRGIRLEHGTFNDYWVTYIDASRDYNFAFNGTLKGYISNVDGIYYPLSDRRLKKNIEPIGHILDKVVQLQPVRYHFKDNPDDLSTKSVGFIAQDVEKYIPDVVGEKDGFKSLAYSQLVVFAIGAIKEQQEQIENLQAEVDALKELVKNKK